MRRWLLTSVLAFLVVAPGVFAAAPAEYRGYWVETFNTPFATQQDVLRIVDAAQQSNANAIFMQVRRRGDAWYLDAKEPLTETAGFGEPDASGRPTLDPLRYLIEHAHARGIEVHAFVIVGSIYREDPAVKLPSDPGHVFLKHVWDRDARAPYTGPQQWATRALPHNARISSDAQTSYDGHRFGTEWYIDLGHPGAAAYTVEVLAHLARQYAIDGIHLDRIRYPEAPIDSARGINVGYNETSVARFVAQFGDRARFYTAADVGTSGITEADVGYPRTDDPLWNQWRRDQVTHFVRRLYLTLKSIRPSIRLSAALITFGNGPTASGGFAGTEPYWRVFQDWQGWAREGLIDLLVPMVYKRAHNTSEAAAFDDWSRFTVATAQENEALGAIGLAAYLNSIEGTLRQVRGVRSAGGDGVVFYALGNTTPGTTASNSTNAAVSSNPFSYPTPNQATPKRPNDDFFAALRSGASSDGRTRFEASSNQPVYAEPAPVPSLTARTYVMGMLRTSAGAEGDGVEVVLEESASGSRHRTRTDGNGFWGFSALPAGSYRATAMMATGPMTSCSFRLEQNTAAQVDVAAPCLPRRRSVVHR